MEVFVVNKINCIYIDTKVFGVFTSKETAIRTIIEYLMLRDDNSEAYESYDYEEIVHKLNDHNEMYLNDDNYFVIERLFIIN